MKGNRAKFKHFYASNLASLYSRDPQYKGYSLYIDAKELAQHNFTLLLASNLCIKSKAIKKTCLDLNIPHNLISINSYLNIK